MIRLNQRCVTRFGAVAMTDRRIAGGSLLLILCSLTRCKHASLGDPESLIRWLGDSASERSADRRPAPQPTFRPATTRVSNCRFVIRHARLRLTARGHGGGIGNGLRWAPDGLAYGCSPPSEVRVVVSDGEKKYQRCPTRLLTMAIDALSRSCRRMPAR